MAARTAPQAASARAGPLQSARRRECRHRACAPCLTDREVCQMACSPGRSPPCSALHQARGDASPLRPRSMRTRRGGLLWLAARLLALPTAPTTLAGAAPPRRQRAPTGVPRHGPGCRATRTRERRGERPRWGHPRGCLEIHDALLLEPRRRAHRAAPRPPRADSRYDDTRLRGVHGASEARLGWVQGALESRTRQVCSARMCSACAAHVQRIASAGRAQACARTATPGAERAVCPEGSGRGRRTVFHVGGAVLAAH